MINTYTKCGRTLLALLFSSIRMVFYAHISEENKAYAMFACDRGNIMIKVFLEVYSSNK